jgi:putative ABC transport system permease protein
MTPYRLLLLAFPRRVRREFGDDMARMFDEQLREARAAGRSTAGLWVHAVLDAAWHGTRERIASFRRPHGFVASDRYLDLPPGEKTMHALGQDFRYTFRLFVKQPVVTLIAVLTLALGIGANTAIFSIVDGVLLRPMPYRDPGQLVFAWTELPWLNIMRAWISGGAVHTFRTEATLFESVSAIRTPTMQLTGSGDPELVQVGLTTTNLMETLGVAPILGRAFTASEGREGGGNVALLGHALWQQRFGGNPAVIGTTISLNGTPTTVIGVMPQDFHFLVHSSLGDPAAPDLWVPGTWNFSTMPPSPFSFAVLARLKPGVSIAAAQAELNVISRRLDETLYQKRGFGWRLVGLQSDLVGRVRPALLILSAAAALLLLIACANVAALLLVRAFGRSREIAVRSALGAGRTRLVRQFLVESTTLALVGGVIGAAAAYAAVAAFKVSAPIDIPRLHELTVDWRALGFALVTALATGLGFGVVPALQGSRAVLTDALRGGTRSTGSVSTERMRSAFVVAELALAVVLLAGALLLVRTFEAVRGADPGFDPSRVLSARILLSPMKYPQAEGAPGFVAQVLERVRAIPGVESAAAGNTNPLSRVTNQWDVTARKGDTPTLTDAIVASPQYFRAHGMTLLKGRDFNESDRADSMPVVVVDDVLARAFWPNEDPVGQSVFFGSTPEIFTVIGVVRQAHLYQLHLTDRGQLYLPLAQRPTRGISLAVRVDGDPSAFARSVREAVWSVDPSQPVATVQPMTTIVNGVLAERRVSATLVSAFAVVAVILAAMGIYGLMAYVVSQRQHEIGIRMAMGAQGADIRRMVLARGILLACCGLAAGTIGAVSASGLIANQLYGVRPADPLTLAVVLVAVVVIALAASYWPARRASRLDAAHLLRSR